MKSGDFSGLSTEEMRIWFDKNRKMKINEHLINISMPIENTSMCSMYASLVTWKTSLSSL